MTLWDIAVWVIEAAGGLVFVALVVWWCVLLFWPVEIVSVDGLEREGYQPTGADVPDPPTTGSGVKPYLHGKDFRVYDAYGQPDEVERRRLMNQDVTLCRRS